ncbi:MAG TPA: hypothetical protein DCQ06_00575 [Myxococcales bacterium]|nr:hypothetical protein [Myxococcales bacterium]HAN30066.1 hypothetical protein [Myxococcales bacterium]
MNTVRTDPGTNPQPVADLLMTTELLVCIGSGGVGKTTTSAALALAAALAGRKTLVLTIDPARRLLQALGLHREDLPANTPLEVLPRMNAELAIESQQVHLDAMMLDPALGASQMVERLLPDPSLRAEVLGNRVYQALLPALGASPDLVALELLAELHGRGTYDLIVLDTPPAHNTMDFLQAGQTFANFINERVLKWFSRIPKRGEANKKSIFRRSTSVAMSVLGRLFGAEILPDIAEFFYSFRDVMPLMRERSRQTDALMRSQSTRFIAITAPGATSAREARHLLSLLTAEGLPFAGFVVNRVLQVSDHSPQQLEDGLRQIESTLSADGVHGVEALLTGLDVAYQRLAHLAVADAGQVDMLRGLAGEGRFCVVVPQLEHDIHKLPELMALGNRLTRPSQAS